MNVLPSTSIFKASIIFFGFTLAGCENGSEPDVQDYASVIHQNGSILVSSGMNDLQRTPVSVEWDGPIPACLESNGEQTPVQYEENDDGNNLLWFSAEVPAGETKTFVPSQQEDCGGLTFQWENGDDHISRLLIDGTPGIEYHFPEFDLENYEETMKPFHHVFAPDGSRLITKGIGGTYTHHRGIFYGYNQVRIGEDAENMNLWSVREDRGEVTEHSGFLKEWAGPVFGGHQIRIDWKDSAGNVFADEIREIKVYKRSDNELLIDIKSDLTSLVDDLHLDGDLHHAGIQFQGGTICG
jgi:hypothetical protein